jgi:hypothetical protein
MHDAMKELCESLEVDFYDLSLKLQLALEHKEPGSTLTLSYGELKVLESALELAGGL